MSLNVYEMQENLYNIGQTLKDTEDKLTDATVEQGDDAIKNIKALTDRRDALKLRYNTLKAQVDKAKAAQGRQAKKTESIIPSDPKQKMIKAEAAWIRKTVRPDNSEFAAKWNQIKDALQDDDASKGNDLLPVNVSNQLVSEPFATNPLRQMEQVSTITNLILPRIAFDLGDDGFIQDGEVAKEMELKGDSVTFGRNQLKVRAGISDTILHGTDTGLVNYVNNALSSALQVKERNVSLNPSATGTEAHMSFYDTSTVKIKSVTGDSMFKAIRKALADLDDAFQDNAQVLMTRGDYYDMLDALSNNSTTLYQAQPEQILGAPVKFTSAATTPIVGDFSYARLNYEIENAMYEQYKDYQKGMNYFQLTAWFDHQILLSSAFRLAKTGSATSGK